MITEILVLILRFVVLTAVQVVLLNNVQLSGFINPYLYVLFVLLLPVKFSRFFTLLLAFISGVTIDMFTNTMGMHAAATVFMAFMRPYVLHFFAPRDGYESDAVPNIRDFGLQWFLVYTSVLVLLHHFVLFYLEVFRFSEFLSTFIRMFFSTIATLVLIVISQYLFGKTKLNR